MYMRPKVCLSADLFVLLVIVLTVLIFCDIFHAKNESEMLCI